METEKLNLQPKACYNSAAAAVRNTLDGISSVRTKLYGEPKWSVETRIKSNESIRDKIQRRRSLEPTYGLESLRDIVGVRVIVNRLGEAVELSSLLERGDILNIVDGEKADFIKRPREDGYRGIHLVFRVVPQVPGCIDCVGELQIRTLLQHEWSILSHSEFYKSVSEIPGSLLARMRALSDILHAADVEAEQLRRGRVLDECGTRIRKLLRKEVLEKLRPVALGEPGGGEEPEEVGRRAIAILDLSKYIRRALVSDGDVQRRALAAVEMLVRRFEGGDSKLYEELSTIIERVRVVTDCVPDASLLEVPGIE